MRLKVRHETHYDFDEPARRTVQYLRMTPRKDRCQRILRWNVESQAKLLPWTDGFGNDAHLVSEDREHVELSVIVEGEIETTDTAGVLPLDDGLPPAMFLRSTPLTLADAAIRALAEPFRRDAPHIPALHDLMQAIADAVSYQPGVTDTASTAADALGHGAGVCQDHAHLFIAAARALGYPARYVSGYLASDDARMASHAWAEAFVQDFGWISFDPSNCQSATDHYIRLAIGFDYAGACPVAGVRAGGGGEELTVRLQVAQIQS